MNDGDKAIMWAFIGLVLVGLMWVTFFNDDERQRGDAITEAESEAYWDAVEDLHR